MRHITPSADNGGDVYEECEMPALGTCVALYAFEGSTDGTTIAMVEGDEMFLLERDEGDG
jgi:hypothetical protein